MQQVKTIRLATEDIEIVGGVSLQQMLVYAVAAIPIHRAGIVFTNNMLVAFLATGFVLVMLHRAVGTLVEQIPTHKIRNYVSFLATGDHYIIRPDRLALPNVIELANPTEPEHLSPTSKEASHGRIPVQSV